jgi:hypothetical protein
MTDNALYLIDPVNLDLFRESSNLWSPIYPPFSVRMKPPMKRLLLFCDILRYKDTVEILAKIRRSKCPS